MYNILIDVVTTFHIIAVITTSISLNISKYKYILLYIFVISIETTSSLISLSIPASTASFYSTGRFYITRFIKWFLIYLTASYLSSSVIQVPTTLTVCKCPSKL